MCSLGDIAQHSSSRSLAYNAECISRHVECHSPSNFWDILPSFPRFSLVLIKTTASSFSYSAAYHTAFCRRTKPGSKFSALSPTSTSTAHYLPVLKLDNEVQDPAIWADDCGDKRAQWWGRQCGGGESRCCRRPGFLDIRAFVHRQTRLPAALFVSTHVHR
ncbi:hypothetical protein FA15DRAFT_124718 [Coprinopsis marcescibilis]|uniref:Uncharacterized protein n=1 Tax=Coprinopsis marcescibilis TaxID=230819 RepID=A0A5C3KJM1_COPMA|nr:hypothetical protein FA15DRAFT_124718 [Coprinopsis marcescibilis]